MNTTPYNTGKVRIGCKYEPPKRVELTAEEVHIQKALLASGKRRLTDQSIAAIGVVLAVGTISMLLS